MVAWASHTWLDQGIYPDWRVGITAKKRSGDIVSRFRMFKDPIGSVQTWQFIESTRQRSFSRLILTEEILPIILCWRLKMEFDLHELLKAQLKKNQYTDLPIDTDFRF